MNIENKKKLAVDLISDNFAKYDYHFGQKVINDVMVLWISSLIKCKHDHVRKYDLITFSDKAREQPKSWEIIGKWSQGYWNYYQRVPVDKVERFSQALSLKDPKNNIKSTRKKILKSLKRMNEEDGIEFVAILIVEWARRFNTKNFIEYVQGLGWSPTPESIEDGSYIPVTVLRFTDMAFHMD